MYTLWGILCKRRSSLRNSSRRCRWGDGKRSSSPQKRCWDLVYPSFGPSMSSAMRRHGSSTPKCGHCHSPCLLSMRVLPTREWWSKRFSRTSCPKRSLLVGKADFRRTPRRGRRGQGAALDGSPSAFGRFDTRFDRRNFLKAQVFYWILAAPDGHAKNFSVFLEPRGRNSIPAIGDRLRRSAVFRERLTVSFRS